MPSHMPFHLSDFFPNAYLFYYSNIDVHSTSLHILKNHYSSLPNAICFTWDDMISFLGLPTNI